eukprot:4532768-Amphidinium_carterae.1
MWTWVDRNLRLARELPCVPFGGVHVVTAGDLYQLPPPKGLPIFANVALWTLFELIELPGNHRASKDPAWAALLARLRVGKWTADDITTLQQRVVRKQTRLRPLEGALHLYATRDATARVNEKLLSDLQRRSEVEEYECPATDTYAKDATPSPPEN